MVALRVVNREQLRAVNLERRKEQLVLLAKDPRVANNKSNLISVQSMLENLETGVIPQAQFVADVARELRVIHDGGKNGIIAEFIGSGNFPAQWYTRQKYEVDAGREEEPIIYPAIYSVTTDQNLPKLIDIYTLGNAGVVFEAVQEGEEVKFASLSSGQKSVRLVHYAVALQYSQELFEFNELFRLGALERQFGIAYNALLNHIHMSPILTNTYDAANQTDGTALTSFKVAASMPEKYLRTLEDAIVSSSTDGTNPRRGPYALLVSTADQFTAERALNRAPQQGFDTQSSALSRVTTIIAYDGWSGTRGHKTVTYPGVESGTGYLINLGTRNIDFQSYFKYPLRRQMGESDMSRFILEQIIWDTWFGVFADPDRAVHEITWPTQASGEA